MTVGELRKILEEYPDNLDVRYDYDSGNDYPTFKTAYRLPADAECFRILGIYKPALVLTED